MLESGSYSSIVNPSLVCCVRLLSGISKKQFRIHLKESHMLDSTARKVALRKFSSLSLLLLVDCANGE